MKFLKKIPSYILFLMLSIVYLGCGLFIGYKEGYKDGQTAYVDYINKLFAVEK